MTRNRLDRMVIGSRVLLTGFALVTFLVVAVGQEDQAHQAAGHSAAADGACDTVRLDSAFPGGNVLVERIENGTIWLRPDLRDTSTWWFYWYFRVRGAHGRELQFVFHGGQPVGVRGPAVSTDRGNTWHWLGAERSDAESFFYRFGPDADEVRFAYTIPYLRSDWDRFLQAYDREPNARPKVLCRSRDGRDVPSLYFGCLDREPRVCVLLACRHHACESMADFVLEGLIDSVLSQETEESNWLKANVQFLAVPLVDADGVEKGDQGKNRRPRDHGRDYAGPSIYPETAAIRSRLPEWSAGRPIVTLDLHCPWIRGKHNQDVYMVGSAVARNWNQQQRFGAILQQVCQGPLPYRASDNLPFGAAWNTAGNYAGGKSLSRWAADQPAVMLAASIEIPYASAGGVEVNPASARALGHDMAVALCRYLRGAKPGEPSRCRTLLGQ